MKVLDVNPFHDGLQRNIVMLSNLQTRMRKIETTVDGLVAMEDSLKGQGGNSIRSFYEACHLPLLNFFIIVKSDLESTLTTMDQALDGLEPANDGFIQQAFLEEDIEAGLTEISQLTGSLTDEANGIMDQVADIVNLPELNDSDVQEAIRDARKKRDNTVTDLNEFDASQTSALISFEGDLATLTAWISDLEGVFREGVTDINFPADQWAALTEKNTLRTDLAQRMAQMDGVRDGSGFSEDSDVNKEVGASATGGAQSTGIPLGYGLLVGYFDDIKKENLLKIPAKLYIYANNKRELGNILKNKQGYSFKLENYRKYNNLLSPEMYKYNSRELLKHLKEHKTKAFTKENLKVLTKGWEPFGTERGKLAMSQEFDKLYGMDKYREFQKLSPLKKTTTILTNELIGDKIKSVKEWTDPKAAFANTTDKIKTSIDDFKKAGALGKTAKIVGKGLGPLSMGIIVGNNLTEHKGDTQKITTGIAVDGVFSAGTTVAGAALGTMIFPGVGTVAGTVVGAGIGVAVGLTTEIKWGDPPKNVKDRTKDLVNDGVDNIQKASKEIGKKIKGWFK